MGDAAKAHGQAGGEPEAKTQLPPCVNCSPYCALKIPMKENGRVMVRCGNLKRVNELNGLRDEAQSGIR